MLYALTRTGAWMSNAAGSVELALLRGMPVADLAIHPEEPDRLYVASPSEGVLRSDDGGVNWQRISTQPALSVAIPDDDVDRVLVGTVRGTLLLTEDGGGSFEMLFPAPALGQTTAIRRLYLAPAAPDVIVVHCADGRLYRRADGSGWRECTPGSRALAALTHPQRPGWLYALTDDAIRAYDGSTWAPVSSAAVEPGATLAFVPPPADALILAGPVTTLPSNVDSDGGGHAIAVRAASFLRTVSADLDEPPHVYGVTYDGALVGSHDAGETWRTLCRGWQRVDHVMPYGLRSV